MPGSRSATTRSWAVPRPTASRAWLCLAEHADALRALPMSGIAGLLRFDERTVTRHDLERTANSLRQYGPDRSEIIASGGIGLVHVLMRMTPEDRFDSQPSRGASGALITADVRLDNRDDVVDRIGVTRQQATAWSDSRVLLAGWEKFGD